MKKVRLWLFSSLVLVLVVLVSSVYTIVYSAGSTQTTSEVFLFNFLSTEQKFGPVVTVSSDFNETNDMINHTMHIAEKFALCPESSAESKHIVYGASVLNPTQFLISERNFVAIPLRVTNNMADFANATIAFTNISSSSLKNVAYYEVYNYANNTKVADIQLTNTTSIATSLERGKFVDLCVVVYAISDDALIIDGVNSVNFNLQVNMSKV